jgi:hypothetical protein
MTSDHTAADSIPAGCKSSPIADWQAIMVPEKQRVKELVIGFCNFTRLGFRLNPDKSAQLDEQNTLVTFQPFRL